MLHTKSHMYRLSLCQGLGCGKTMGPAQGQTFPRAFSGANLIPCRALPAFRIQANHPVIDTTIPNLGLNLCSQDLQVTWERFRRVFDKSSYGP